MWCFKILSDGVCVCFGKYGGKVMKCQYFDNNIYIHFIYGNMNILL